MNNAHAQTLTPPTPPKLNASATTCIVGCKLPHGLVCQIFSDDLKSVVESHTIKGMNDVRIVGGYGLTEGIPTEFMTEWLKRNKSHPAVANGSIFIHTSVQGAQARAKEGREIRSGLEAIDPMNRKDSRRHGIVNDKESDAAYRKQVAENPERNRQIVE